MNITAIKVFFFKKQNNMNLEIYYLPDYETVANIL